MGDRMKLHYRWYRVWNGLNIGMIKYAYFDAASYTLDEQQRIVSAHARFMLGIMHLEQFSTRDYAYDAGGMAISDQEMNEEFKISSWVRRERKAS